jgi:hypothetical protein
MVASFSMSPSVALAAFADSLLAGHNVLVFGRATNCLWEKLLERGARLVHVCDPDPARVAEAAARNTRQAVSFAPLPNQVSLALRDGAFDVGFIDNLSALGDLPATLRSMRRALSARALAFIAAPNPEASEALLPDANPQREALDYYSLYDAVHHEFPIVRMLGQMPFVGYTIAELAMLDEVEPSLDAGFVPSGTEEPEWFVAVASARPFDIGNFTVVQLPFEEVLAHGCERQLREQLRAARGAERIAVQRLARLEAQQHQLAESAVQAQQDAGLQGRLQTLEQQLTTEQSRAERAEAQLAGTERQLHEALQRAQAAEQIAADAANDLARLEQQLQERGECIRQLEADLHAAGQVGERLLRELGDARNLAAEPWVAASWSSGSPDASERARSGTSTSQSPEQTSAWVSQQASGGNSNREEPWDPERLAADRARLQADAIAAAWRIDQLLAALQIARHAEPTGENPDSLLGLAQRRLHEQQALIHQLRGTSSER